MKPDIQFYGRRKGHPLRVQSQDLFENLFPKISVPTPELGASLDVGSLFPHPERPLWLEIGFGRGEHCAQQAENNPNVNYIGCEPFMNGVAGLLQEVDARGLENVRILMEDVRFLLPALPEASVERVFLLFPDPWPKKRHNKRRFISPENLDLVSRVLKDGGEFRFATDHADYCEWGLERLMNHPDFEWTAEAAADWKNRPADWVETRYERKALAKGDSCSYLRFRRIAR